MGTSQTIAATTKFDGLLPAEAITVETSLDATWESGLLSKEAECIRNAIPKRRREFTAGRNCARSALQRLGEEPVPILVGSRREPIFPSDVSGTITHTRGYCAAAVMRRGRALSIGIDAERNDALGDDVAAQILLPEERALVNALPRQDFFPGTLIFSIKESFYKAFFQISARYLDFLDVHVEIAPETRSFSVRVLRGDVDEYFQGISFHGSYNFDAERLYSAIALLDGNQRPKPYWTGNQAPMA